VWGAQHRGRNRGGSSPPSAARNYDNTLIGNRRGQFVKLPPRADFSSETAEVRRWPGANGSTPSRFKYDLVRKAVIFQILESNMPKPRSRFSRNHFL
jgi:hypothetical protein